MKKLSIVCLAVVMAVAFGFGNAFAVEPEEVEVAIDIKFCSDPNAFNCKSKGKTPVTIFGAENLDVTQIDISSLSLCIDVGPTCVLSAPLAWSFADRGDPTTDLGAAECAIVDEVEQDYLNQDGYLDLDVAFDSQEIADLIGCDGLDKNGVSVALHITGMLLDGMTTISSVPVILNGSGIDQLVKKK